MAIHMNVSADCEPVGELKKLVTIAGRGCVVANTICEAVDQTIVIV